MGKPKEDYFIVYSSTEICSLPEFHVFEALKIPVDIVVDDVTLLQKVENRRPKAIVVIGTSGLASKLRAGETVDDIPIFAFDSIEAAGKVISHL